MMCYMYACDPTGVSIREMTVLCITFSMYVVVYMSFKFNLVALVLAR